MTMTTRGCLFGFFVRKKNSNPRRRDTFKRRGEPASQPVSALGVHPLNPFFFVGDGDTIKWTKLAT